MTGAKKFFLSIVILATFLPSGFSQQAQKVPSEKRSVLVNVIDAHGNAVRDLTKDNFHVRVNGKPAVVLDARYSLAPRRIVLLLDMSGSMIAETASGKWRIAREAADDLLAETPAEMPIAMLTFSRKVGDVFDFSQGRAAIAKWLKEGPGRRSNLQGGTALFDAILEGLKLLQPVQPGDAVYAITDGGDNVSHALADGTELALLQSDVRLFAFLFADHDVDPVEQEGRRFFLSMVADTGGL
jgi:Mg-chelatase subunit ChlD